ncbi:MAG: 3-methyl-2-oxobutanoate hydroxymethyltransferase [Chloroflexota bacterium]|nr:3-methyl-2-oxobutanoate hydroxymethyltransferase [Chloroflexota bacterium]
MPVRTSVPQILEMARRGERITAITAYDYAMARLVDSCGVPIILVGDSLSNNMLGYEGTIPVTMDDMLRHAAAVVRGSEHALVIGDMPFMSYQADEADAIRNAGRFLKEAGCQAVKLEGGRTVAGTIRKLVGFGIPVMGHLGLTPQSLNTIGGYRVQGRTVKQARILLEDAVAIEEAGAFSLVLEYVAAPVAKLISDRLQIPTIGIGAGPHCDGQVQIIHDILGLAPDIHFKHTRRYAEIGEAIRQAVAAYKDDVVAGGFPAAGESFAMKPEDEAELASL